jgi:hypothetical protein
LRLELLGTPASPADVGAAAACFVMLLLLCGRMRQVQAAKQVEALQSTEQAVRQEGKQLQQQVAADLSKQQQEVQQLMTRHSADVARDTIKQFKADQVCLCACWQRSVLAMWRVWMFAWWCNATAASKWAVLFQHQPVLCHVWVHDTSASGRAAAMHGDD